MAILDVWRYRPQEMISRQTCVLDWYMRSIHTPVVISLVWNQLLLIISVRGGLFGTADTGGVLTFAFIVLHFSIPSIYPI